MTDHLRSVLQEGSESLGVILDSTALDRFSLFLEQLLQWNQKHNLTAIRDPEEVVTRHFLDSLTCVKGFDFSTGKPVIDVGTGAGFPGIPLKIAFPDLPLTLLEASGKKVEFLQHLAPILGYGDLDIAHARAEDFGHVRTYRGKFQLCVSRAVAALPTLAEFCLPFVAQGGYFIAQKNADLGDELEQGREASLALGGGEVEVIPVTVPGTDLQRALIRIRKENRTLSPYPRRPGVPGKRPLGVPGTGERPHPKYR